MGRLTCNELKRIEVHGVFSGSSEFGQRDAKTTDCFQVHFGFVFALLHYKQNNVDILTIENEYASIESYWHSG